MKECTSPVYAGQIKEPELMTPSNGSEGISPSTRLGWKATPGAFGYDVYLDTANPPQRVVAANVKVASFSPTNLASLTTYYWKVVAKGDPFCEPFRSAESEVWSFATTSSCDVPGAFGEAGTPN